MTSTQTRRAREDVDVPSLFAAIDAVKGQSEIAQSDDNAGDARTATSGEQERTAAAPSPGHLAREDDAEPNARLSRLGRGRRAPQHLRPGQETGAGMADLSPRGGGVRMSLLSVAGLLAWPLYTDCEAWTWT